MRFLLAIGLLLLGLTSQAQVRVFSSLTNLIATDPFAYSTGNRLDVEVLGYYAASDWGSPRSFSTTSDSGGLSTNRGTVFRNAIRTNYYHIANDRSAVMQDLRWWGPQTNGAGTAHIALREAATWMTNGGTILLAAQRFKFGSDVYLTNNVSLEGAGPQLTILDFTEAVLATNAPGIRYYGYVSATNRVTANLVAGTNKVVLAANPGLQTGDLFVLHDTNDWSYGGTRAYYHAGQFGNVRAVTNGTEILMTDSIIEPISASTTPVANGLECLRIVPVTTRLSGFKIVTSPIGRGIDIIWGRNCAISDLEGTGSSRDHVAIFNSYNTQLSGIVVDYDSDPSVLGLNYGVVIGGCDYVNADRCFLRTGKHGFTTGNSTTGVGIPNSFVHVRDSTVGTTREFQFGADFHANIRYSSYRHCDLPGGVDLLGNNISLVGCNIVNPESFQAIWLASSGGLLGANFTIEDNDITFRNALGSTPTVARINWSASLDAGANPNRWAGSMGNTEGQWLRIVGNRIRFLYPVASSQYGFVIDEATALGANPNAGRATFGGIEFRANVFQFPSNQVFQNVAGETAGLYLQTRSNMVWRSWIVEDNDFGIMSLRSSGAARDFKINRNKWSDSLNLNGSIFLQPNFPAYDSLSDIEIRGNSFRRSAGPAVFSQDTIGTLTIADNIVEDWARFATDSAIVLNASTGNQAWSTNSLKRVMLDGNSYNSSTNTITTASRIDAVMATELHKRGEAFKGFASDSGTVPSAGLTDAISFRTNNARATLPLRPGALTLAQQAAITTADDGSLAWDATGGKLIKSVNGFWSDINAAGPGGTVTASNLIAHTLTVVNALDPAALPLLADTYTPIYSYNSASNLLSTWYHNNANTGNLAGVRLSQSVNGANGLLYTLPTNFLNSFLSGRTTLDNDATGITIRAYGPASDIRLEIGGATSNKMVLNSGQATFNGVDLVVSNGLTGTNILAELSRKATSSGTNLWTGTSNLFTGRVIAQGDLSGSNLIGNNLSLVNPWSIGQGPLATPMNPLFSYQANQNAVYTWTLQNAFSGNAAYTRLLLATVGASGSLYVFPTAYSSAPSAGRTVLDNNNAGIKMLANSGDFRIDAGGGVDNLVVTNGLTTIGTAATKLKATAGSATHLLGFPADAASTAQTIATIAGATGDMLYYNGGWQRMVIGSPGNFLKVSGGLPVWSATTLLLDVTGIVTKSGIRAVVTNETLTLSIVPLGRSVHVGISNTVAAVPVLTVTIPAGTLDEDGEGIVIEVSGECANSTGSGRNLAFQATINGITVFPNYSGPNIASSAAPNSRALNGRIVFKRASAMTCDGTDFQHVGAAAAPNGYAYGSRASSSATGGRGWKGVPVDWNLPVTLTLALRPSTASTNLWAILDATANKK